MWLLEETQRLADSDALTGLQNRRRATQRMEHELSRARRYGTAFSVLLCDVDHFKSVNDRFGHNMGDEVLTKVAHTLKQTQRQVDLAGRWGGEEFLVLLTNTDAEGARATAERLRAAVEAIPAFEGGPEHVTCSIGGATFAGEDSATAFLERADQALYRAKERGRNRVELG
jgi:diguanylate cyclase (GGDEF)-like protein